MGGRGRGRALVGERGEEGRSQVVVRMCYHSATLCSSETLQLAQNFKPLSRFSYNLGLSYSL